MCDGRGVWCVCVQGCSSMYQVGQAIDSITPGLETSGRLLN